MLKNPMETLKGCINILHHNVTHGFLGLYTLLTIFWLLIISGDIMHRFIYVG